MYRAERNLSNIPFMFGNGYASFFDILLTFLKSKQNRYFPFGFLTMTIGFDHSLKDDSIIPAFNILSTSARIASCTTCDTK